MFEKFSVEDIRAIEKKTRYIEEILFDIYVIQFGSSIIVVIANLLNTLQTRY